MILDLDVVALGLHVVAHQHIYVMLKYTCNCNAISLRPFLVIVLEFIKIKSGHKRNIKI